MQKKRRLKHSVFIDEKPMNSLRPVKTAIVVLILAISFASSGCSKKTKLGIQGLPDRFIDRETAGEAYYMPRSRLIMDGAAVIGREGRLDHKYPHADGTSYILHVQRVHYDKFAIVDPDYEYQMNLQIPSELMRPGEKILAREMKGYLVWGGANSIYESEYCPLETQKDYVDPKSGILHIKRFDDSGALVASADLFFSDPQTGKPVRIFGHIVARPTTRAEVISEEARAEGDIYRRAHNVERDSWFQKPSKKR